MLSRHVSSNAASVFIRGFDKGWCHVSVHAFGDWSQLGRTDGRKELPQSVYRDGCLSCWQTGGVSSTDSIHGSFQPDGRKVCALLGEFTVPATPANGRDRPGSTIKNVCAAVELYDHKSGSIQPCHGYLSPIPYFCFRRRNRMDIGHGQDDSDKGLSARLSSSTSRCVRPLSGNTRMCTCSWKCRLVRFRVFGTVTAVMSRRERNADCET